MRFPVSSQALERTTPLTRLGRTALPPVLSARRGPREFDRHFQEARHAHSMRCLGIQNTKAYHGITLIDDAYAMQKQLAEEERRKRFVPEVDEEYEDSMGNVMPKKTYEDLARQGLL